MGLLAESLVHIKNSWPILLLGLIFVHLLRNRYKTHLSSIPGPLLASLSQLWLFYHCFLGRSANDFELHQKYKTKLLRLGPSTVAVSDVEAVKIIYGWKRVFPKASISSTFAPSRSHVH